MSLQIHRFKLHVNLKVYILIHICVVRSLGTDRWSPLMARRPRASNPARTRPSATSTPLTKAVMVTQLRAAWPLVQRRTWPASCQHPRCLACRRCRGRTPTAKHRRVAGLVRQGPCAPRCMLWSLVVAPSTCRLFSSLFRWHAFDFDDTRVVDSVGGFNGFGMDPVFAVTFFFVFDVAHTAYVHFSPDDADQ